jgi:hypothetical protein
MADGSRAIVGMAAGGIRLIPCLAPPAAQFAGYVPRVQAVSPAGRIAVPVAPSTLAIYARHEAGTTCTYVLDAGYGDGGMVTFPAPYFEIQWDYDERLYVSGQLDTSSSDALPGLFQRVASGGHVDSCRYTAKASASVMDEMPDDMTVLAHGEKAFLQWGSRPEDQLDLAGASLGDGSQACDFVPGTVDGQRHTSALSVSTGGLLFLQTIDGVDRAVETDNDLVPLRTFGGSASPLDAASLKSVKALSRCSAGYCAAADCCDLKVFDAQGTFVGATNLGQALGLGAFYPNLLTPASDGGAWLRANAYNPSASVYDDFVIRLAAAL